MIDEHKLMRDQGRALQVNEFLNHPLLKEAIEGTERALIEAWKTSSARDIEGREKAWVTIQQIGNILGYFQSILNGGKLAEKDLQELYETTARDKRSGL